ncbi:hypothetical protein DFJ63DRAFT_332808 [Scheffersomyces coipomensis]|uniref:uncharacterized protein n=1 Tax=Scheffersomyces coipomensis TaxID=1788519 RepID=UPI00315CA087
MGSMYNHDYTIRFLHDYFPQLCPDLILEINQYLPMEYVILWLIDLPAIQSSLLAHYSNTTITYANDTPFTSSTNPQTNEILLRRFLKYFIPRRVFLNDIDILKLPSTVFQCNEIYFNCKDDLHPNEITFEDLSSLCQIKGIKGLSFKLSGTTPTNTESNIFYNSQLKTLKHDFDSFSLCDYKLPPTLETLTTIWSPNINSSIIPNLTNLTIFIPPYLHNTYPVTTLPSTLINLEIISQYGNNSFPFIVSDENEWPPLLQSVKVSSPHDTVPEVTIWPHDLQTADFGCGTVTLPTIQTLPQKVESLSFGTVMEDDIIDFPPNLHTLTCGIVDRTVFLKLPIGSALFQNLKVLELVNSYLTYEEVSVDWHLFTGLESLTFNRRDVSSFTKCELPPPNLIELNIIECYYSFQTPWKWPIFTKKSAFPKLTKLNFNLVSMIDLVPEVVFPPKLEYFQFTSCVSMFCVTPEIYNHEHLTHLKIFDTNAVKFFNNGKNDQRGKSNLQHLEISSYVFSFYVHSVEGGSYDLLYDQIEWRFGRHIKKRYYDSQETYIIEFDSDL